MKIVKDSVLTLFGTGSSKDAIKLFGKENVARGVKEIDNALKMLYPA